MTIPYRRLHPQAVPPLQGSEHAAGYDFCCVGGLVGVDVEAWTARDPAIVKAWRRLESLGETTLHPGGSELFRTGIALAIPEDYRMEWRDRSGLGTVQGVTHTGGLIDPDYRGELSVRLVNMSDVAVTIHVGDRIIQGVFSHRIGANFSVATELPHSTRGNTGFGNSGR